MILQLSVKNKVLNLQELQMIIRKLFVSMFGMDLRRMQQK